jgi:hypothetical protein
MLINHIQRRRGAAGFDRQWHLLTWEFGPWRVVELLATRSWLTIVGSETNFRDTRMSSISGLVPSMSARARVYWHSVSVSI